MLLLHCAGSDGTTKNGQPIYVDLESHRSGSINNTTKRQNRERSVALAVTANEECCEIFFCCLEGS